MADIFCVIKFDSLWGLSMSKPYTCSQLHTGIWNRIGSLSLRSRGYTMMKCWLYFGSNWENLPFFRKSLCYNVFFLPPSINEVLTELVKEEKPLDLLCCERCKHHVIQQQREKFTLGSLRSLKSFWHRHNKKRTVAMLFNRKYNHSGILII